MDNIHNNRRTYYGSSQREATRTSQPSFGYAERDIPVLAQDQIHHATDQSQAPPPARFLLLADSHIPVYDLFVQHNNRVIPSHQLAQFRVNGRQIGNGLTGIIAAINERLGVHGSPWEITSRTEGYILARSRSL